MYLMLCLISLVKRGGHQHASVLRGFSYRMFF